MLSEREGRKAEGKYGSECTTEKGEVGEKKSALTAPTLCCIVLVLL